MPLRKSVAVSAHLADQQPACDRTLMIAYLEDYETEGYPIASKYGLRHQLTEGWSAKAGMTCPHQ